jgi:hypothetical protein
MLFTKVPASVGYNKVRLTKKTHLTEESDLSEIESAQYACERIPYEIS